MKNDRAANLVRSLVDNLSLNSDEALKLEQEAEKIYDLGFEDGRNNYQRTMNPADQLQPAAKVKAPSLTPIEPVQPKTVQPRSIEDGRLVIFYKDGSHDLEPIENTHIDLTDPKNSVVSGIFVGPTPQDARIAVDQWGGRKA